MSGAKYLAIADALERSVAQGDLRGGDRLPTQRKLATQLGVDLTTITRAYDTARQRGVIEARGRLGSFVLEPTATGFGKLDQVDTAMNMPPLLPENLIGKAIADGTTALLRQGSGAGLQYQLPGGALQDRIAGAALLSSICTKTEAEQVVLTAGGQNALHAVLMATLKPGDALACGPYVYSGLRALAARLGLRLVSLHEICGQAIEEVIVTQGVKACYLVPTNDNPTASTLDLRERKVIAKVIVNHGIQLIEDDAYGPLAADAPVPVTAFAPRCSWYISSLSKVISPALRIAYVRTPTVAAALTLAGDVHEIAIMAPPINAALASRWIRDGTYNQLIAEMRKEAALRRGLASIELDGLRYEMANGGYHLWLPAPNGLAGREVADAIRSTGLSIVAAEKFAVGNAPDNAVRISLGGLADHETIRRALRTLKGFLTAPTLGMVV